LTGFAWFGEYISRCQSFFFINRNNVDPGNYFFCYFLPKATGPNSSEIFFGFGDACRLFGHDLSPQFMQCGHDDLTK